MKHDIEMVRDRLLQWYRLASAENRAAGIQWYRNARMFCGEVADKYDLDLATVVGVVAALSPGVRWESNCRQAEELCKAAYHGTPLDTVILSTYGKQAEKARTILRHSSGQPAQIEGILGRRAFKTIAFFRNIADLKSEDVTVDTHIVNAADFQELFVSSAAWCYRLIESAVQDIAMRPCSGLRPCQVQAIIWLTYKELKDRTDSAVDTDSIPDDTADGVPV